jgi:hypothetical protein
METIVGSVKYFVIILLLIKDKEKWVAYRSNRKSIKKGKQSRYFICLDTVFKMFYQMYLTPSANP